MGDRRHRREDQPIQSNCYACDEWSAKFFVNDNENPYTTDPGKPFRWIRGRQVGGRSIMWGRQVYRWSDLDFEANLRDGIAVDWPIRYADIAPWYDYVEGFIGVSGEAQGLPQLPDGEFLPPMELNCAEQVVRDELAKHFGGERVLTIGRSAILTQAHNGRAACHYCGPCERGCITRSYFNSVNATLPAAEKTGRMTLRPYSVVHSLIFDPATRQSDRRPRDRRPDRKAARVPRQSCISLRLHASNPPAFCSTHPRPNFPTASPTPAANWATTSWTTSWAAALTALSPAWKIAISSATVPTASTCRVSAT